MRSQITVRTEIFATHHWGGAPEHRKYLAHDHAHVFKIEGRAPVSHSDRQIEFHDLLAKLQRVISELPYYHVTGEPPTFKGMSCEHIGEGILKQMPELSSVTVSEDGQFDATVTRDESPHPTVITLCGSTKFKKEFLEAQRSLEAQGYAVFSVGCFPHADGEDVSSIKDSLDELHKRKIDMSDAIYVINPGGYIGQSTRSEIEYARSHNKAILSLEPVQL